MVVVQASKLLLPRASSLSSPQVTSLLFEPHTLSLALMHYDSSFSLYPSLSLLTLPPPPPPLPTLVPNPSSSASFLLLRSQNPNHRNPRVLFVVAGPHAAGSCVILRFWILRKSQVFAKPRVLCSQGDLRSRDGSGVVFNVRHGVSVKISGSVNYFAMHSASNSKIWLFAVKMANEGDDDDEGLALKLIKCAVVDCSLPVCSIIMSVEFLILGEGNGVRVLPLRLMLKGQKKKQRREDKSSKGSLDNAKEVQNFNLPNGVLPMNGDANDPSSNLGISSKVMAGIDAHGATGASSSILLERKDDTHSLPVKQRQDLGYASAYFVPFRSNEAVSLHSTMAQISKRAISIQALAANKFLILDSVGDLHCLCLSNLIRHSEIPSCLRQLTHNMKMRKLAVLLDSSSRSQTFWVSDGLHTVHLMGLSDKEVSCRENEKDDNEEKLMQTSVAQAIFTSERIQDIAPLDANAILILGQEDIFVYAIS